MIHVTSLSKTFDGRAVLSSVSLQVGPSEVVALVGPSGGGKSTLLRCMNGLETFDSGEIRVGAHVLGAGPHASQARAVHEIRQDLGFVFQQWNLFAHRTALGNVIEAPMVVRGWTRERATERARALLERTGLANREGAYPREMSGGEQQRVAIARALAMDPRALLMDEPTSALDPERVAGVIDLLRGLAQEGLALVIVTHEMRVVRALATRVVVLHGGKITEEGTPSAVLDEPRDEATRAFLGGGQR